jgi:hypothetical protein
MTQLCLKSISIQPRKQFHSGILEITVAGHASRMVGKEQGAQIYPLHATKCSMNSSHDNASAEQIIGRRPKKIAAFVMPYADNFEHYDRGNRRRKPKSFLQT